MIGTPQLGTPLTIASMLHGEGEHLGLGFITDRNDVRSLARNMQSAYNLLPSENYFNRVTDPVVTFDSGTAFTQVWRNFWGLVLGNFTEYSNFLIGNGPNRYRPDYYAYKEPEVLRGYLFNTAGVLHANLDFYDFPSNIRVVQVAGWGLETPKGIIYSESDGELDYFVSYTSEGDNTVVYPSAVSSTGAETYFVNLATFNRFNLLNDGGHRNMSGILPVRESLIEIILKKEINGVAHISTIKPPIDNLEKKLLVSVHSPMEISVSDAEGNYTGIEENEPVPGVRLVSREIPNSSYVPFGEGKYIFVPQNGDYTFSFEGTARGRATIIIKEVTRDIPTPTAIFSDFRVTPRTDIKLVLNKNTEVPELAVDRNGDGVVDVTIKPDGHEEEGSSNQGSGSQGGSSNTSGSVDTGEYYKDPSRWEVNI